MPAHTRVCQCGAGIQAEQWPQRSQQMIKAAGCPCFSGLFLYHLTSLLADGFIPTMFVRASSKNVGRRWKQLVQGGLLPVILPGWTNSTGQAGRGREGRIEGVRSEGWCTLPRGRLGGPDARGTEGALFVLCRQNGGSCCCLGPSAHPRVRLYRIPQLSTTSLPPPLPQSLTNTCPSIHPHLPISWGCAAFCRCPGERADVQRQEDRTFIVSVARQKRFLLPLRRSL